MPVTITDEGDGTVGAEDGELHEALRQFLLSDEEAEADGPQPSAVLCVAETFLAQLRAAQLSVGMQRADAVKIGNDAAEAAVSALAWSDAVGERYDTSQVCRMLSVTRQALAQRQQKGSLIGLPGNRTTWYPAWQFDVRARRIRSVVPDIVAAFREHLDPCSSAVIAAWATNPQLEDLAGSTPADWIRQGRDEHMVVTAAGRAAEHFAQ